MPLWAAQPAYTTAPIARVEVGGHAEEIRGIAVAPDGHTLISVGVDKTARLWRTDSGRLERIIRLPIDSGERDLREHEGKLYSAAYSPDGRGVILGGFTRSSYSGPQPFTLLGIDLAARDPHGAPVLRYGQLGGLPTAVQTLTLAKDGSVLAACLTGSAGLVIYDWASLVAGRGRLILQDTLAEGDACYGVDSASNGDVVISTRKGAVKLYHRAEGYLHPDTLALGEFARPKHPRFSPDESWIAFGSETSPRFGVVQTSAPNRVISVAAPSGDDVRGLFAVEWSADGRELWAGGERRSSLEGPLYRIHEPFSGSAGFDRVLVSERRIDDLRRLPDGAIAYAGAEPELGVIGPDGHPRWRKRSNTIALSPERAELRVSEDGSRLAFRPSSSAKVWLTFDADTAPDAALGTTDPARVDLKAPQRETPGKRFEISDSREDLRINGAAVDLLPEERVLDHLVAAAGVTYIGTSWFVRKLGADGRSQWATPVSAEVQAIAASGNGQLLVAALTDGTVRWFRTQDGVEVLALLALRNGVEWVAWVPPGYYVSSTSGDSLIGWHLNEPTRAGSYDVAFYRALQFDRLFYRPDVVRAYFKALGRGAAEQWSQGEGRFDIARIRSYAPPRLDIETGQAAAGTGVVPVHVFGVAAEAPPQDWNLFVDGIPVVPNTLRGLSERERSSGQFEKAFDVIPQQRHVALRAESTTTARVSSGTDASSLAFTETSIDVPASSATVRGKLFLFAAGVGLFDDRSIPALQFASRDAEEFTQTMQRLNAARFSAVRSLVLSDTGARHATRAEIQQVEHFFDEARGEDTVIVFLASHGLSNRRGDYYFVPRDASHRDIDAVLAGSSGSGATLIPWTTFFTALQHSAGHRIMIVDTCSSSAIQGTFDAHSLAKRSLSSAFALLAASKDSEESQELAKEGHGLFTSSLLEALRTGYDPNHDGVVSLDEAFEFAFDRVQTLRNHAVGPQTPQFVSPDVLKTWGLAPALPRTAQLQRRNQ